MRPVYLHEDLDEINAWYRARGMGEVTIEELPLIGFIEPRVAVGFLYRTDACVCFLEGFVSNPAAASGARNVALTGIASALIKTAKAKGFSIIMAMTRVESMAERARRFEFEPVGQFAAFKKEVR